MDQRAADQTETPSRRGFVAGLWATIPMLFAVVPFGLIFGALAVDVGLTPTETLAMSGAVIAGAAQLAALQLMVEDAPALVAILTGAVVNLRNAMYSASLATHLERAGMRWRIPLAYFIFDQSYALSLRRYGEHPEESLGDKLGFFFGVGVFTASVWFVTCAIGIFIGGRIPPEWSLEFVVPVVFLALAAPMIRGRAHVVAAVVASFVAFIAAGLPYGSGLMIGSVLGIAAGMMVLERKEPSDE